MSEIAEQEFVPSERIRTSSHVVFILCVVMVVAFGVWSTISTLDIVSMATGEVIPSTQVKTIQHLEGGIVREILVREGSKVKRGQSLVVLEPTQSGADVGELRVRLTSLRIDIARLDALTKGGDAPEVPDDLKRDHAILVKQGLKRFAIRTRHHRSQLKRQSEAIKQRRQEVREITIRIKNGKHSLKLVEEQLAISAELLRDDLTNRFLHLNLLKETSQLRAGTEADIVARERANSALVEARAELDNIRNSFDEENQDALDDARLNYRELNQRIQKFEDSLKRTVVRSPVDGTIKTLYVVTVGGVIRPGDTVVDIVPAGDRLIIEAKLPTQDIGYVALGQAAIIKLASADAMRFGGLKGNVVNISPDTLLTPEGMPFYKVRIETESDHFQRGQLRYNLFPGMQVIANIQTGKRTVLQYILDPLRGAMSDALQER